MGISRKKEMAPESAGNHYPRKTRLIPARLRQIVSELVPSHEEEPLDDLWQDNRRANDDKSLGILDLGGLLTTRVAT